MARSLDAKIAEHLLGEGPQLLKAAWRHLEASRGQLRPVHVLDSLEVGRSCHLKQLDAVCAMHKLDAESCDVQFAFDTL